MIFLRNLILFYDDNLRVQVGFDDGENSRIYLDLGFDLGEFSVDFSTAESSAGSLNKIDELLNVLTNKQSSIGASYNRLQSITQSNMVAIENFNSSKSVIKDADIAKESSNLVKTQIPPD